MDKSKLFGKMLDTFGSLLLLYFISFFKAVMMLSKIFCNSLTHFPMILT
jgi:hypothetical protein